MEIKSVMFLMWFIMTTAVSSDTVNTTFNATHEWKTVGEGQTIPAGLHVRINLKTGKKEAKLLDENDTKDPVNALTNAVQEPTSNLNFIKPEEIEKLLKNLKSDSKKKRQELMSKFRSYEELQDAINDLKMKVSTDSEILVSLIDTFKKLTDANVPGEAFTIDSRDEILKDELLAIIKDLEFLVHKYDNGIDFVKLNGINDVIHRSLNLTNAEVRAEALKLLGSATQSNPAVQRAALSAGSIGYILRTLALDKDMMVKRRATYAISCLVRGFPLGQEKLLHEGALSVFGILFEDINEDMFNLQIKIITLIYDLMHERDFARELGSEKNLKNVSESDAKDLKHKMNIYNDLKLEERLVKNNWCNILGKWFLKVIFEQLEDDKMKEYLTSHALASRIQHDIIEKIIETMIIVSEGCKHEFTTQDQLRLALNKLLIVYEHLALSETVAIDEDNYYEGISDRIKTLINKITRIVKLNDEL